MWLLLFTFKKYVKVTLHQRWEVTKYKNFITALK